MANFKGLKIFIFLPALLLIISALIKAGTKFSLLGDFYYPISFGIILIACYHKNLRFKLTHSLLFSTVGSIVLFTAFYFLFFFISILLRELSNNIFSFIQGKEAIHTQISFFLIFSVISTIGTFAFYRYLYSAATTKNDGIIQILMIIFISVFLYFNEFEMATNNMRFIKVPFVFWQIIVATGIAIKISSSRWR